MHSYMDYFQIFDKKIKVEVKAYSREHAQQKVRDALKIDKIEIVKNDIDTPDFLKDIFGKFK